MGILHCRAIPADNYTDVTDEAFEVKVDFTHPIINSQKAVILDHIQEGPEHTKSKLGRLHAHLRSHGVGQ